MALSLGFLATTFLGVDPKAAKYLHDAHCACKLTGPRIMPRPKGQKCRHAEVFIKITQVRIAQM